MLVYVARRLALAVPLLLGLTLLTFVISHAVPADPVVATLGQRAADSPEIVRRFRERYGLDRPLPVQYVRYLQALLSGDWGVSISSGRPVLEDIRQYLPATVELATVAIALSVGLGVPLGIASARRRGRLTDHASRLVAVAGVSVPVFWLGLMALVVFYWWLGLAPGPGRLSARYAAPPAVTGLYLVDSLLAGDLATFRAAAAHIWLPASVLALYTMGIVVRVTRAALLEVFAEDYLRTARAKGASERRVVYRHALRNAMLPTLTMIGLAYGSLLSGAVMTETVFAWPGLGLYAFRTSTVLDFPAIMGVTLVIGLVYVAVNLVVDLLHAVLDPRVRPAR